MPHPMMLSLPLLFGSLASAAGFALTSPELEGGRLSHTHAFQGFGCTGANESPELRWENPPDGTASFAVMVHDADAPTGGAGWWHWVVFDIPASAGGLPHGTSAEPGLPSGARLGTTDFGVPGWGGPCPPQGAAPHTYTFTVYALPEATLSIPDGATASLIGFMINSKALGSASLTAQYRR